MSDTVSCSCRIPWLIAAVCALAAGAVLALPRSTPPAAAPAPAAPADAALAEARHEADELRRIYNDAQSALAQRDREIATAEDELRTLRKQVEELRAKPATAP